MSLGFKRVISSIMAFVMMVSTLVMVNVASVSAADATWDFNSTTWQANSTSKTVYTVDGLSVRHNGASTMNEVNTFKFDKNSREDLTGGYYCQLDLDAGDVVSVDCYYSTNNLTNVALRLTQSTDTTTSNGDVKTASASKTQVGTVTFDAVSTTGTYYIVTDTTSTGSTYYASVSKTAGATPTTYTATGSLSGFNGTTFTLSKDGVTYTATVTGDGFTVSSATPLTAGEYTVQADGYEDTTVTLALNGENAFTFAEGITFTPVTVTTVTVMPTDTGYSFTTAAAGTLTTDNSLGSAYASSNSDELKVTIGNTGATLADTNATSTSPNMVYMYMPMTATIAGTAAGQVTYSGTISGISGAGGKWSPLSFVDGTGNTIAAIRTSSSSGTPDDTNEEALTNKFSLAIPDGSNYHYYETDTPNTGTEGFAYTVVFDYTAKTVSLTIGDATVTSAAIDSLPAVARLQGVTRGSSATSYTIGDIAISVTPVSSDTTTVATTEEVTEATTAATTEEATEAPTEEPTEGSTEAPVTPAEGYVPMGNYDLNESVITDKDNFEYNGMTFANINTLDADHIRLDATSTITFKVAEACTLTINLTNNNDVQINGGTYTNYVIDGADRSVNVTLEPDVEYVISGTSGGAGRLSNLTFTAGGSTEEPTEGTTAEVTETTTEAAVGEEIAVPISITGNTGNVTIKINGTNRTFGPDDSIDLYVNEGSAITFEFATNVANKITGWTGLDPDSYSSSTKQFTATATEAGVQFTYDANACTAIDDDFAVAGTSDQLAYGNYGYGATKGTATGATQAERVAALNSVSGVVTLCDYQGGYRSGDARLILNANSSTGVKFTAQGAGYIIIDCSIDTPVVKVNGKTFTVYDEVNNPTGEMDKVGGSGKLGFEVEAGDEVEIRSGLSSGDSTKSLQLKSVRFQTDGNVFTKVSADVVDYDSLGSETKAALGDVSAADGKVFARLVGSLDTTQVDADSIKGVGFIIISKSLADAEFGEEGSKAFIPANYVNSEDAITIEEDEALYDGIYDGSDAAEGEYTLDTSTEYNDGTYYMLSFAALAQGDYYVLPYTVDNAGTNIFDFATATSADQLNSYAFSAQ